MTARAKAHPFELSKLKWMLTGEKIDQARVDRADKSIPVIVTEYEPGKFVTMDGFHRVVKAIQAGDKTIPAVVVSKAMVSQLPEVK